MGLSEDVVLETGLSDLELLHQGKVRDIYDLGYALLFVATDRISAFDVILPEGIPGKGRILTMLSLFWFQWLSKMEDMPRSHLITAAFEDFPPDCNAYRPILEGRSMLVRKATPIPVECIVRGYLSGSGWKDYLQCGSISGQTLPPGLMESEALPEAIFTPSTKSAVGGHDLNISFEEMQSMIGADLAKRVREISLTIYKRALKKAKACGIILADTKMEFGLDPATGDLLLIDELLTPDSSRFWPEASYSPGKAQPSFDKQFVRDYLLSIEWNGSPPPPHLPEAIVRQTRRRYDEALKALTAETE
ncbi:MAG: phosphoribosylaminoimidazolesuccinocarboxamide synthase [Nitrospiria bacterium]